MTVTSTIKISGSARWQNTVDLGGSSASRLIDVAVSLVDGTGAGQADRAFFDTRQLAASATEDLDLAGTLVDAFGVTQTFARVKLVIVRAHATNTNQVQVTRDADAGVPLFMAAGDGVSLRPGAVFALAAGAADATGYAVTATTGDLLVVTNSGAGSVVDYDIAILGCSA
jgi:hypothetical protein